VGWAWDWNVYPFWWYDGVVFPAFGYAPEVPYNSWQCIAYDEYQNPYVASAPNREEAAYSALYDCGGPQYQQECYIPQGYCNLRN
jgi:hypothetical protein